jgi:hypothetical protein
MNEIKTRDYGAEGRVIEIRGNEIYMLKMGMTCEGVVPIVFSSDLPALGQDIQFLQVNIWEICSPEEEQQLFNTALGLARRDYNWPRLAENAKVEWKEAGGIGLVPDMDFLFQGE